MNNQSSQGFGIAVFYGSFAAIVIGFVIGFFSGCGSNADNTGVVIPPVPTVTTTVDASDSVATSSDAGVQDTGVATSSSDAASTDSGSPDSGTTDSSVATDSGKSDGGVVNTDAGSTADSGSTADTGASRTVKITFTGVVAGSNVSQRFCIGDLVALGDHREDTLATWYGPYSSFGSDVYNSANQYTVTRVIPANRSLRFQCEDVMPGTDAGTYNTYGCSPAGSPNVTVTVGGTPLPILHIPATYGGAHCQVD